MWKLRRLVRQGDFDVIHGNLWQSNLYCRVAVVGMRNRPAVVISERNVEARRSLFKRLLDRWLAQLTDAYVGNTDAVGEFIKRMHAVDAAKTVVIPNAVDRVSSTRLRVSASVTQHGSAPSDASTPRRDSTSWLTPLACSPLIGRWSSSSSATASRGKVSKNKQPGFR